MTLEFRLTWDEACDDDDEEWSPKSRVFTELGDVLKARDAKLAAPAGTYHNIQAWDRLAGQWELLK